MYVSINNKEFRLAAVPQGSNPQTIQVREWWRAGSADACCCVHATVVPGPHL